MGFERYSRAVEVYPRPEAAERAGVSVEELDRLVELEILKPDAEDHPDKRSSTRLS